MAIYKIFSEKDTFISKHRNNQNFGRDEILEISNETNTSSLNNDVNRILIQFEDSQINNLINTINSEYKIFLKLFLANATIPKNYTIYTYPLNQHWEMGLGKSSDSPITTQGVTWDTQPNYNNNYSGSQTFIYINNKDINLDITNISKQWHSGSINNNGLILKFPENLEEYPKYNSSVYGESIYLELLNNNYIQSDYGSPLPPSLKFFSMDTHTIYPPHLEFKWDDSIYSSSLTPITSINSHLSITNLKSEFKEDAIYDFKIKLRDKFPARSFQTSSVYLSTKCLPSSSYWGLQDIKTGEMVIDFDPNYTKISCNNENNYFKIYMNGLEPERYYKILIKTELLDEVMIFDYETNYFKIIK